MNPRQQQKKRRKRWQLGRLLTEVSGLLFAVSVRLISRMAWSGGISTVIAARVGGSLLLSKRPAKAACYAAAILFLPDLYASAWFIDLFVECAGVVKARERKKLASADLLVVGDVAWRLVAVFSRHNKRMDTQLDRLAQKGFWKASFFKACVPKLHDNPFLAAARWSLVALVWVLFELRSDTLVRRVVVAAWISQRFLLRK